MALAEVLTGYREVGAVPNTRTLQTSKVHRGKPVDALGWYGTITCGEMRLAGGSKSYW